MSGRRRWTWTRPSSTSWDGASRRTRARAPLVFAWSGTERVRRRRAPGCGTFLAGTSGSGPPSWSLSPTSGASLDWSSHARTGCASASPIQRALPCTPSPAAVRSALTSSASRTTFPWRRWRAASSRQASRRRWLQCMPTAGSEATSSAGPARKPTSRALVWGGARHRPPTLLSVAGRCTASMPAPVAGWARTPDAPRPLRLSSVVPAPLLPCS
jgi:hypothetical protein